MFLSLSQVSDPGQVSLALGSESRCSVIGWLLVPVAPFTLQPGLQLVSCGVQNKSKLTAMSLGFLSHTRERGNDPC